MAVHRKIVGEGISGYNDIAEFFPGEKPFIL